MSLNEDRAYFYLWFESPQENVYISRAYEHLNGSKTCKTFLVANNWSSLFAS